MVYIELKLLLRGDVMTYDGHAACHVIKFPRPSPSILDTASDQKLEV